VVAAKDVLIAVQPAPRAGFGAKGSPLVQRWNR
jgi:hypothetical protein